MRQLNRHGITVRPARNTTLIAVAAELPAAVLADTVGLHPNTAVRWARLANSAWASYLAAAPQPPTTGTPRDLPDRPRSGPQWLTELVEKGEVARGDSWAAIMPEPATARTGIAVPRPSAGPRRASPVVAVNWLPPGR